MIKIVLLQGIFNYLLSSVTLRYIGVNQGNIDLIHNTLDD